MSAGDAGGLRFSDDKYLVTVTETPASDTDDEIYVDSMEPTPVSGVVLTAICTQSDGNPVADSSDLRYSVTEGGVSVFSIDVMSGEFSVADQPFDYEEEPWYLVSLLCYLDSDPGTNGTGAVNVTIGPVNEYLPEIESSSTTGTIPETAPVGTVIAAVDSSTGPLLSYRATDRDNGPDGIIKYSFSDRAMQQFGLDENTGTLTLRQHLDIDNLPHDITFERLEIGVSGCNSGIPISLCKSIVFIVFVTSVNEHDPRFQQSQYIETTPESSPNGTVVEQVTCVDEDNGHGSIQSILFHNETSELVLAAFRLNSTGAVVLQGSLDYEEGAVSYQFQVVCSDGVTEARAQVSVVVLPVNDNPPHFTEERYQFSVQRSSPAGHSVGQVQAVDEDISIGSNITYSIQDSTNFNINPQTGEITIEDNILYLEGSKFDFTVLAFDGEFTDRVTVHIVVTGPLSLLEIGVTSAVALLLILITFAVCVCACCCYRQRKLSRSRYIYIPPGPTMSIIIIVFIVYTSPLLIFNQNY